MIQNKKNTLFTQEDLQHIPEWLHCILKNCESRQWTSCGLQTPEEETSSHRPSLFKITLKFKKKINKIATKSTSFFWGKNSQEFHKQYPRELGKTFLKFFTWRKVIFTHSSIMNPNSATAIFHSKEKGPKPVLTSPAVLVNRIY